MAEYRVDLSSLDQVVRRLNGLVKSMDGVTETAAYHTEIPEGWLGKGFVEEHQLRTVHTGMRNDLNNMIVELQNIIREFGDGTSTAHQNYEASEDEVRNSLR